MGYPLSSTNSTYSGAGLMSAKRPGGFAKLGIIILLFAIVQFAFAAEDKSAGFGLSIFPTKSSFSYIAENVLIFDHANTIETLCQSFDFHSFCIGNADINRQWKRFPASYHETFRQSLIGSF